MNSSCYAVVLSKIIQDEVLSDSRKIGDRVRTTGGRRLEGAGFSFLEVWQIKQKHQPKCKHAADLTTGFCFPSETLGNHLI